MEGMADRPDKIEIVLARSMRFMPDHWRCGRCGQEIRLDLGHGWRFDGEVWRPTAYHRRQRRHAEARLQDASLSGADRVRDRDRLGSNQFSRSRERPWLGDNDQSRGTGTRRFPKNYAECPRCQVVNALNPHFFPFYLPAEGME